MDHISHHIIRMKLEGCRVKNVFLYQVEDRESEGDEPEETTEHLEPVGGRVVHLSECNRMVGAVKLNSVFL